MGLIADLTMRRVAVAEDAQRPRRVRLALLLLVTAAVLRGLLWIAALPPWQGPDENSHYAYVERLAHLQLPRGQTRIDSVAEVASTAATAADAFGGRKPSRPFTGETRAALPPEPDGLSTQGGGAGFASDYPPLYYVAVTPLSVLPGLDRATERLYAVRVGSALLGGLIVLLTFALVRELTGEASLALLAAALATLPPMLTQASAIVNPDVALTAATAGLAYACVRLRRRGRSRRRIAAVVGAALAVALVKPVGTPFAVVEVAMLLGVPWVLRRPRRGAPIAGAALLAGGAATFVVGVDTFDLGAAHRGVLGTARYAFNYLWEFYLPPVAGMIDDVRPGPLTDPVPAWAVWVKSGVGWFGYLNFTLPDWAYWLAVASVAGAALAAIAAWLVRRRGVPAAGWATTGTGALPLALTVLGFVGVLHAAEFASLATGGDRIMQGRYLLPAWPIFLAAVSAPFARGSVRAGQVVLLGLCVVWLLLDIVSLDAVLAFYAT